MVFDERQQNNRKRGDSAVSAYLRYADGCRWLIALGCVLSFASVVLALVPYLCIWRIASEILEALPNLSAASDATRAAWAAVGCAAASVIAYRGSLICTHRAAFHIAARIRTVCCEHLLRVPLGYFQRVPSGELRRHIDTGADMTEDVIAHKLPDVVGALTAPVAFIVLSFVFDWRMGLACLVPIILGVALLGMTTGRSAVASMDDYQDALDAMNSEAVEYVRGMPVVKMFQQTVHSFKRFHHSIVAYGNLAFGFAQAAERPQLCFTLVTGSTFVLLVPVAAFAAAVTEPKDWARFAADTIFYATLCGMTPGMLARAMYVGQSAMSARTALRNVDAILAVEPLAQPENPKQMRDASIAFDKVCFSYTGTSRDAVSHVTFKVEPGQVVALVGPSGSGKSTCASLIPRFWDVRSGSVKVGGCDVRDLDPRDLMENVAFVFQNGRLLCDTVLENVRAARPEATRDEVMAALTQAQCDDIVAKLPHGADTVIGEGGVYLSGGEQQRVLLARAILKDAAIVVLDEATAFADADNEERIRQSLKCVMNDRTVVMVAHRLSTVTHADQILVLADGAIAQRGTHAGLVKADGPYRRMWNDYCSSVNWEVAGFSPDTGTPAPVSTLAGVTLEKEATGDES